MNATSRTDAPEIDLHDPTFWRDRQHEAWTWCRANDPVHRDDKSGFLAVTRHADVVHVERHPETYSSPGSRTCEATATTR